MRLLGVLMDDPGTQVAASVRGWAYPLSREAGVTADLWDLELRKGGGKKQVAYPRPWDNVAKVRRHGEAAGLTNAQVLEIVRPTSAA